MIKHHCMPYARSLSVAGVILASLTVGIGILHAESYNYYVEEGKSGDGSSSDPFGSIKDAVEESQEKGGKKIFVRKGTYSSAFTLPKGVELVGSDAKEVSITGVFRMEDKSKISQIGVAGLGGGIIIAGNADVSIKQIRIKGIGGTGINAEEGNGTVSISDSVIDGARKGMYIQAGHEVRFEDLEVVGVAEEGIDIRENVSGNIQKSSFKNNGESGIEVVLGSSSLVIESNTFSGNGASAIAAQFYSGSKKVGNVRIEKNIFSKNDYGVDCKAPQGGMDSKFYFLNSLSITGNTFTDNKEGEIAKRCKVLTDEERIALEVEEEKKRQLEVEQKTGLSISESELADRFGKAVALRQEYDAVRVSEEVGRVEGVLTQIDGLVGPLQEIGKRSQEDRSGIMCFLFGPDYRAQATFADTLPLVFSLLDRLALEKEGLATEEGRNLADDGLQSTRLIIEGLEQGLLTSPCGRSLFGWANRLFTEYLNTPASVITEADQNLSFFRKDVAARLLFIGDLAYYPKVRESVIRSGDGAFFSAVQDAFRGYDTVVADLAVPMTSDTDPLPPVGSGVALSFPLRFANIFSAYNVRLAHLGDTALFTQNPEAYTKTRIGLSHAGVASFGVPLGEPARQIMPNGQAMNFLQYHESRPGDLAAVRERITTLRDVPNKEGIVVFVSWDQKRNKLTIDDPRKDLAKMLIDAGAALVVGTGLSIPAQNESIGAGKVYYSLGSALADFQKSLNPEARFARAVELVVSKDQPPVFSEKVIVFDEKSGLQLSQ